MRKHSTFTTSANFTSYAAHRSVNICEWLSRTSQSQNACSDIALGNDTILFVVTTSHRFDVEDVSNGKRALQFIKPVPANDIILCLATDAHPPEPSFELVSSETGEFRDILLGDRDVMFILTTEAPIQVQKFTAGNESILFIGQLPRLAIERLATQFELKFTSNECGIYSSRFHPDFDTFISMRNRLWYLAGALESLSVQRQLNSYEALQNQPGYALGDALGVAGRPPASANTIQALRKEKKEVAAPGNLDEEVCSVCLAALEVTKLPCGHYFHFVCIKPWLETVDSCPQCRSSVDPTSRSS
ncbi:uncharacterized protein RAG0_07845 [Rhynchosporium agropyri]|uniref:RING-type E3 ubiquitin transferase n=1 Tax=Rhynchosporium agropyri TaxID=914238 RepID=A0A1E1KNA1_9HELO|nr:uncharacterized protein RAG0_07845 [Rhynchosporium agropyri]